MTKREELRKKMLPGDWQLVGKMLGISAGNAFMTFTRSASKRYPSVVEAIEKVIENREQLFINNNISHEKEN